MNIISGSRMHIEPGNTVGEMKITSIPHDDWYLPYFSGFKISREESDSGLTFIPGQYYPEGLFFEMPVPVFYTQILTANTIHCVGDIPFTFFKAELKLYDKEFSNYKLLSLKSEDLQINIYDLVTIVNFCNNYIAQGYYIGDFNLNHFMNNKNYRTRNFDIKTFIDHLEIEVVSSVVHDKSITQEMIGYFEAKLTNFHEYAHNHYIDRLFQKFSTDKFLGFRSEIPEEFVIILNQTGGENKFVTYHNCWSADLPQKIKRIFQEWMVENFNVDDFYIAELRDKRNYIKD